MGGQAFTQIKSERPINVPRLSPELYKQVADDVTSKLETLFHHVTIPREAPGKADYGDVDFLVEGIRTSNTNDVWSMIEALLDAELHVSHGSSHSFGVKHPCIPEAYVQVDVELCPGSDTPDGAELFEWTKFMKSDSDLTQIIGIVHRSLGITCNDRGLHIRVEEVEPYNRKKSMLFLTRDPGQAMDFYGYDKAKYWQGFSSESDLFEWVVNGRYFYWKIYEDRDENSNDRSRLNKRPMFRRFVQDFLPSHVKATTSNDATSENHSGSNELGQAVAARPTRQDVLQEALRMFDKYEEYNAIIAEHQTNGLEDALWREITDSIPLRGPSQGTTLRGLKRWVAFEDGRPYITKQPLQGTKLRWTDHVRIDALPDLLAWIEENREEVRKLEEHRADEARKATKKSGG